MVAVVKDVVKCLAEDAVAASAWSPSPAVWFIQTAGEGMLISQGTMRQCRLRLHKEVHKAERSGEGLGHRGGYRRRASSSKERLVVCSLTCATFPKGRD